MAEKEASNGQGQKRRYELVILAGHRSSFDNGPKIDRTNRKMYNSLGRFDAVVYAVPGESDVNHVNGLKLGFTRRATRAWHNSVN